MLLGLEEYLGIASEGIHNLEVLEKYANLHTKYSLFDIQIFYEKYSYHLVNFGPQKITLTEIFYNCEEFMSHTSVSLFLQISSNWFVVKNGLLQSLQDSGSELYSFLTGLDCDHPYSYLIKRSDKAIELAKQGRIFPFMVECGPEDIPLNKHSFSYLINRKIDISSLMAYSGLSIEEIKLLVKKLVNNRQFLNDCKKFIESNGVSNETMLIVASLCQYNTLLDGTHSQNIHKYYCSRHFDHIYLPFSAFHSVLEMTSLEVYFLYLSHKASIRNDLEDIFIAIKTSDATFHIDTNLTVKETSIQACILNLVFSENLQLAYDPDVYKYLSELPNESYFQTICKKFAKEIIEDRLIHPIPDCLGDLMTILAYLKLRISAEQNFKIIETSISISNFESSSIIKSTDAILELPLISFNEYGWLTNIEKTDLLACYIKSLDINETVCNFLETASVSDEIISYFANGIDNIRDRALRACVHCKVNSLMNNHKLSDKDIKTVISTMPNAFQIRKYLYQKKLPKIILEKFVLGLTFEQLEIIIKEITCEDVDQSFAVIFIRHIEKKYEFSHLFEMLLSLLDSKKPAKARMVQDYLIGLLESQFVHEEHLPLIERLYFKMLEFQAQEIKKNNDKLLILIGKVIKLMEKEPFIGHLRKVL